VLFGWGLDNFSGPSIISGVGPASQATGGRLHAVVLQTDGTVKAWGFNGSGQLGNGTTTDSATPVSVSGLTNVIAIAARQDSSLALTSDGHVWAWGSNNAGQLGDGTNTDRSTPVQVSGLTNITAISLGLAHALALRSDGTVWAWGNDFSGELGVNEAFNSHTTPVQTLGLTDVTAIATGSGRSFALKSDGTVWAWGSNAFNDLGDGSSADQHTPVQLSLSNIVSIGAGPIHAFALDANGVVWAWGDNLRTEIGDGTNSDRNVPVAISGPGMAWRVSAPTGTFLYFCRVSVKFATPQKRCASIIRKVRKFCRCTRGSRLKSRSAYSSRTRAGASCWQPMSPRPRSPCRAYAM